jgi:hypothetical protein
LTAFYAVQVKEKWISFLMADLARRPPASQREELIVEGKLSKVQPLCTTNMTRWWQVRVLFGCLGL